MSKPPIRKYSGKKKKIQSKLFHKRERREAVELTQDKDSRVRKVTYCFFENARYITLNNSSVDQYYFSSSRKGWQYYGIIVKIFRNENGLEKEESEPVFVGQGIGIYRSIFDNKNYAEFSNHIKYVAQEERVLKYLKDDLSFWRPYEATEFRFYVDTNERVGAYYTPELLAAINKEFKDAQLSYFGVESFAIFCGLEHLPLDAEHASVLFYEFYNLFDDSTGKFMVQGYLINMYDGLVTRGASEWAKNNFVVDFQSFATGIDGDLLFKHLPLEMVSSNDNVQIFKPGYYSSDEKISGPWGDYIYPEELVNSQHEQRIVKITNFKNSGLNYWFFYGYERGSTRDEMEFMLAIFEKSDIHLHE